MNTEWCGFEFSNLSESGGNIQRVSAHCTWPDLADAFYDFLLGCGFSLDKQDLSDHFDQSVFSKSASSEDEDLSDQFAPLEENHAERYGQQPVGPQRQFANPPRLVYQFSVSDSGTQLSMPSVWTLAQRSSIEQQEFELNSGGSRWPEHKLVLTGCTVNDSSDGLRYLFEVWSV